MQQILRELSKKAVGRTATRADATLSGPPCFVDGNTIQVGGKIRNGKCWGGINVRLYGSEAPAPGISCTNSRGKTWACGDEALKSIRKIVRQKEAACYHVDGEFDGHAPVATCISGRIDVAREMILRGLARMPEGINRYKLEEADARRTQRGIWK